MSSESGPECLFYHLERQPLERVLPSLLEKTLERGWRAVVQTTSAVQTKQLDEWLWTYSEGSFLAHVTAQDAGAALTPIVLTDGVDNPNTADVRFLLDGGECADVSSYQRCVHLFDGTDAVVLARVRAAWKSAKSSGLTATYWQQSDTGKWARKA